MYYPLKFECEYRSDPSGGRNLERLGKNLPDGNISESLEISAREDALSVISNGIFKGQTLFSLIEKTGNRVIGSEFVRRNKAEFPLLFKLIDANMRRSVQVHPDDKYAYIFENKGLGKHEAWYIVSAKPGAKIAFSVIPGVDRTRFISAVRRNKVTTYLNYLSVSPGDTIDICPGVLHAIGENIVLAVIQQNSDVTYRVFDYDRIDAHGEKKSLQLKKAMDVAIFDTANQKAKYAGLSIELAHDCIQTYKLANKLFSIELLQIDGRIEQSTDGSRFYIYYLLEGSAVIQHKKGFTSMEKGESVLIPAFLGEFSLSGDFKALRIYVPNLINDIYAPLLAAQYSKKEISENVLGKKFDPLQAGGVAFGKK